MIAGSFLGGVLARPATEFPNLFSENGLFGLYPFLLPCLVSAALNVVGLALGYFFLRETVFTAAGPSGKSETHFSRVNNKEESSSDHDQELVTLDQVEISRTVDEPVDVRSMTFCSGLLYTLKQFSVAIRQREVMVTMLLYATHAALWICFDEVFAVWALQSPSVGGLNFKEQSIGIAHAISGVGMLLLQIFVYPYLDKKLGSRRAFQITIGMFGGMLTFSLDKGC